MGDTENTALSGTIDYYTYSQITDELGYYIELLKDGVLSEPYQVYDEFTDNLAATPIVWPTVTVGIQNVESANHWLNNYLGTVKDIATYGKLVTVTYVITVHSPVTKGGNACTTFLCNVRDRVYSAYGHHVSEIKSGEIKYDRSRRCLYAPIYLTAKYII